MGRKKQGKMRKGMATAEILALPTLLVIMTGAVVFALRFWESIELTKKSLKAAEKASFLIKDLERIRPFAHEIDYYNSSHFSITAYNGCVVDYSYDSAAKILTEKVDCPPKKSVPVKTTRYKLDGFTVSTLPAGVFKITFDAGNKATYGLLF